MWRFDLFSLLKYKYSVRECNKRYAKTEFLSLSLLKDEILNKEKRNSISCYEYLLEIMRLFNFENFE